MHARFYLAGHAHGAVRTLQDFGFLSPEIAREWIERAFTTAGIPTEQVSGGITMTIGVAIAEADEDNPEQ